MKKFKVAWSGFLEGFEHSSVKIQFIFALLAFIVSIGLKFTIQENINLLLCIGLVITTELINTCIEKICDMITLDKNDHIRQIKDISAGAVLFTSFIALVIGCIMVINHL